MNDKYLAEALQSYNLSGAETEFIRHHENMTFRVDGKYLLRIHRSANGFNAGMHYVGLDRNGIYKSETDFLIHLKKCGMSVQTPIANFNGEFLTILSDGTSADMFTWIDGHSVDRNDIDCAVCCDIGKMAADIHRFSRSFQPNCFLSYNSVFCSRMKNRLYEMTGKGAFNEKRINIMADAWDVISEKLKTAESEFIPIHADLAPSNILITKSGLLPIDFSLFGYGHPMFDISEIFANINGVENRRNIAKGYKANGGTIDFSMLDCCFAMSVLSCVILNCNSWAEQDWFDERLERWCRQNFIPTVQGKPLFSEDFYLLNVD
ncbi:MAG: phosphotransferase [Ruminococcus sp.]|nr:phosphotransferase [Ruminococcus sp.]